MRVPACCLACAFLILAALALSARGQDLEGRFTLDKPTFLVGEPIFLSLEMINRSGHTLTLVTGGAGAAARSLLCPLLALASSQLLPATLEAPMYARVGQFRIQAGKLEEFQQVFRWVIPAAKKEKGFRGLLILRGGVEAPLDGHVISLWETVEDLRASEKSPYFYGALARVLRCCEGFPAILEQEVLCSEFVKAA